MLTSDTRHSGEARPHAGWRQGITLAGQSIFPTMGAILFVPVVPKIMAEFSTMPNSNYWVISLLTIPGLCIAFFSPLAGWLSDRMGRRKLLVAALALYGFAGAAPLAFASFGSIFIARAILGICEAVILTLSTTLIADYFNGLERDRWLAAVGLTASVAGIIFAPLGGYIGSVAGWRAVAGLYAISLIFVPLMLRNTWEPKPAAPTSVGSDPMDVVFPWRHVLICGVASLLGSVLLYGIVFNEGLAFNELGVTDPARIGTYIAIAGLSTPLGSLAFWKLGRLGVAFLLPLAFLLVGCALMFMSFSSTPVQFGVGVAAGLFGCGLILPTLLKWTLDGAPLAYRGRCSGIFQSTYAAGQFVSGLLIQWLAGNVVDGVVGALGILGILTACAGIVSAFLFLRGRMRSKSAFQAG